MFRKFALLAVLAAVATPAAASDTISMRVSLKGKDRATIEADVTAAARNVCRQAVAPLATSDLRACVADARANALRQIAAAQGAVQTASL